jgi:hypothetical protein
MRPIESAHCPPNRWVAHAARTALCFTLLLALRVAAQNAPGSLRSVSPQIRQSSDGMEGNPNGSSIQDEKRLRALNAERQKSMVSDTNKLLMLVDELNAEIARSNPDSLTPAQMRKVAEIEKLAHSVRNKMSTTVQGAPPDRQPSFPRR